MVSDKFFSGLGFNLTSLHWGRWVLYAVLGWGLGVAAWGTGRVPLVALVMPIVVMTAPSRTACFLAGMGYHLAVVRFFPGYVADWLSNEWLAWVLWIVLGGASAIGWCVAWTGKRQWWARAAAMGMALLLTVLPPIGLLVSGHPSAAVGYLFTGWGWFGLALMGVAWIAGNCVWPMLSPVARHTGLLACALALFAQGLIQPVPQAGAAGNIMAMDTAWGKLEVTDDANLARIEAIGKMIASFSAEHPDADNAILVFPESVLPGYDDSFRFAMKNEIVRRLRRTGLTVVIGITVQPDPSLKADNLALIIRPDGSTMTVSQRQPALFTMWHPWDQAGHFDADWRRGHTASFGDMAARFVFCYEEYLPWMHLLSELGMEAQPGVVIALSNLWPSKSRLVMDIQAGHTAGFALLFGRALVRATNR